MRLDAILDARFVYTQVFAGWGGEHGIIDVLTITRSGRLAILELKASEPIHLPVQVADCWLGGLGTWSWANFARMDIFLELKFSRLRRWFTWRLRRCDFTRRPEQC